MMKQRLILSLLTSIGLSLVAFVPSSYALSTDRDQPADISADEINVNTQTGTRTFIGNVRFVQGTLRVKGDRVDATFKDGKLVKAIAYGKPAAFRQRPDGKKDDVEGRGLTIIMNQKNNTLTLKKKASLKQGFDVAKGSVIVYNMEKDTLKVKGGPNNSATGSTGNNKPANSKPKTQTDPFFNEKTTELEATPKPSNKGTGQAPVDSVQVAPSSNLVPPVDDTPEKIILPGQSSTKKSGRESTGRSRLIIKPKSK